MFETVLRKSKMATGYTTKGEWKETNMGQVYTAKAISKKGRILAISSFEIPIAFGFDLINYYGKAIEMCEIKALEIVKKIADATPEKLV